MDIPIVYVDDALVVLDKPAGLLTVPGVGPANKTNLAVLVQKRFPDALVVHRLDRDTSGLLVMARGADAHRALSRQFQMRTVSKRYVAIVDGSLNEATGRIELPIRKDFEHPPRHRVDHAHGRPAVTDWRTVDRDSDRTRLELAPLTGRSHQLRLHLAAIGHPVLGDPLYAGDRAFMMSNRLLLHASRLTIAHPETGELLSWVSECPF
jgi:tRNA pseudouridine32 synthase/23S rRNA pseudouridine746 synthase